MGAAEVKKARDDERVTARIAERGKAKGGSTEPPEAKPKAKKKVKG